jgi:hypothetical protein
VRGTLPPSYNVIEIDADEVRIAMRQPGLGVQGEEPLAHFARRPVTTSELHPRLERFVRYDAEPFADSGQRDEGAVAWAPEPGPVALPARERGPTIVAVLEGGPLAGRRIDAEVVEGRPPKTIDVDDDGSTYRYGLSEWMQAGPTAAYTFLDRV